MSYLLSSGVIFTPKKKPIEQEAASSSNAWAGPELIDPAANALWGGSWSDIKYLLLCDGRNIPTQSINQQLAEARLDIANCCGSETLIGVRRAELFKSQ